MRSPCCASRSATTASAAPRPRTVRAARPLRPRGGDERGAASGQPARRRHDGRATIPLREHRAVRAGPRRTRDVAARGMWRTFPPERSARSPRARRPPARRQCGDAQRRRTGRSAPCRLRITAITATTPAPIRSHQDRVTARQRRQASAPNVPTTREQARRRPTREIADARDAPAQRDRAFTVRHGCRASSPERTPPCTARGLRPRAVPRPTTRSLRPTRMTATAGSANEEDRHDRRLRPGALALAALAGLALAVRIFKQYERGGAVPSRARAGAARAARG